MEVDDELERFVREEYSRLVRVVAIVTGSRPLAEDSVQEALARAWGRAARGQELRNLAAWVTTVALNHARSGRRRRQFEHRTMRRLGVEDATRASGPEQDLVLALRQAVEGLPRRQRDAVVLYYLVDLDVSTVAAQLGISTGTVKTALARARQKLAARLVEREEERR